MHGDFSCTAGINKQNLSFGNHICRCFVDLNVANVSTSRLNDAVFFTCHPFDGFGGGGVASNLRGEFRLASLRELFVHRPPDSGFLGRFLSPRCGRRWHLSTRNADGRRKPTEAMRSTR
jgi:hypothetical protein